jgi:hypothetical protein
MGFPLIKMSSKFCMHSSKPSSVNATLFDPHKLEREGGDIHT